MIKTAFKKFRAGKRKTAAFLALLAAGLVFIPAISSAQLSEMITASNLSPYVASTSQYFLTLATQMVQGLSLLMMSSFLLDTAIANSILWIDIQNRFAQTGLNITLALADALLIAVFVAIAMAYVFKIESFRAEKAILKLFAVALLIHFAPMFVGMVTDVANIMMSGIAANSKSAFSDVFVNDFGASVGLSILPMIANFNSAASSSLGGVIGIAANLASLTLTTGNLVAAAPDYIAKIIALNIIAGLMFVHAVFFLARIFIIQALTVLSPLAILCAAMPQTKAYFGMWKSWLLGWTFGGILLLFLLILGINVLNETIALAEPPAASLTMGDKTFSLDAAWIFKWMTLAIYIVSMDLICLSLISTFGARAKSGEGAIKKITRQITTIAGRGEPEIKAGTENLPRPAATPRRPPDYRMPERTPAPVDIDYPGGTVRG